MSDSEETIYSTMFKSLKHPVRRKILRVLSDKPTSFSDMLGELGVSSSHLTYHLESLGELVSKLDGGSYKLSTFGEAAVNTMRLVEDAPVVQTSQKWNMSFRWKPVFAALIVAIVLLASFSVLQFNNIGLMEVEQKKLQDKVDQLSSYAASTLPSMSFLRDVIQLDLTKYDVELLSNTQTSLDGVIQQSLVYSLKSADSSMTVNMLFKKNMLSSYSVSLLGGTPIYDGPQPFIVLDSAKWLIQKMTSYEHEPYFVEMNTTLYQFNEASSITLQQGNLKFNLSTAGTITTMQWYYTENDVDFPLKSLKLTFDGLTLKELDDSYFLYTIANAQVNVNQAQAIQLAKNAIQGYTWSSGGQSVSGYTVQDATAVFDPTPREDPLALVPHWTVTLYLTNLPASTNINRLSVGVWADTGKTEPVRALSG